MSDPVKFMGQQEDPEMAVIEARGSTRIYDGTKPTLLDDVRAFIQRHADSQNFCIEGGASDPTTCECVACALNRDGRALLARIDGGER